VVEGYFVMLKHSIRHIALAVMSAASVFCFVASLSSAQQPTPAQSPATSSTATPQAPATKSPKPSSNLRRVMRRFTYVCEGDAKVLMGTTGGTTRVVFKDHIYIMKQVEATSGTKYYDGSVVWWIEGEEGFLEDDSKPEKKQMLAKDCHLQTPVVPPTSVAATSVATVSGTASYLQRIAMSPDAVLIVQLQDVSQADLSAKVIAEQKITFGQRQVPIPFELTFDPAKIDPKHSYSVSARILTGNDLRFTSDKSYPVLTQGNPSKADLILVQATP
jgi:putative lipoprotein